MIRGFTFKNNKGGSTFGVVNASSDELAKARVAEEAQVDPGAVSIIDAEEALHQYRNVAFLVPAEL